MPRSAWAWFLALAGAGVLFEFAPAYWLEGRLKPALSAETRGIVEELSRHKRSGKAATYTVQYSFSVSRRGYTGWHTCSCNELDRLRPGDTLLVRYALKDPAVNRPASVHYNEKVFLGFVAAGTGLLLAGAALALRAILAKG